MRPCRRRDLDHRLEPIHAARAVAHDLDIELALRCRRRDCAPRPRRRRRQPPRHRPERKCAAAHRVGLRDERIELLFVEAADNPAVEHRRRRDRAQAEAIDRLKRDAPSAVVSPNCNAEPRFARAPQARRRRGLAGFGAAELQHVAARGLAAEVVIEGDDAVHLGARDVQRLRDHRLSGFVDVAERLLQGVQNRQQRAFEAPVLGDDLRGSFRAPWFVIRHASAAPRYKSDMTVRGALKILELLQNMRITAANQ